MFALRAKIIFEENNFVIFSPAPDGKIQLAPSQ